MMRTVAVAALLFLSVSSVLGQTPDDIVEKHLAALGGRAALGQIRTRVSKGAVTVETAVGPISGTVEAFARAPNKSRTLVTLDARSIGAGKIVNDQRFDGTSGYIIDTLNGNRDITGAPLDALRNNAFPTVWLDYRARGLSIVLTGNETLAGRPAYALEITPKTGPRVRAWVDTETLMLVRTSMQPEAPQAGQGEQIMEYGDFRAVDGVKVPFLVKSISGGQTVTVMLSDVTHNVEVDDAGFLKP